MITIEIVECYGEYKTTTLTARTDDLEVAIERAIKKHTGRSNIYFWRDNGISIGADALAGSQYGQLVAPGGNCITYRVRISATGV